MLTATLLKPNRLNIGGRIWERGKEEQVDAATARALLNDPRFKIGGLESFLEKASQQTDGDEVVEDAAPAKPTNKDELYTAIRNAVDQLDVDDEDSFTATGKPQVAALEKILGYDITAAERDAAIEAASRGKLDEVEDKAARRGGVVIKKVSAKSKSDEKAGEEGETSEANDPTTAGAVEV